MELAAFGILLGNEKIFAVEKIPDPPHSRRLPLCRLAAYVGAVAVYRIIAVAYYAVERKTEAGSFIGGGKSLHLKPSGITRKKAAFAEPDV